MRPSVLKILTFIVHRAIAGIVYCRHDHMQLVFVGLFFALLLAGHTFPPLAMFVSLFALGAVRVVQLLASVVRLAYIICTAIRSKDKSCLGFTGDCRGMERR